MSQVHAKWILAIASGKGGTGKTTVAVNLAALLARRGRPVQYLDCDVEEPNGHLFLKPVMERMETCGILVPVVDKEKCDGCRKCAEICQYHAIIVPKKALVFDELCHGCGGCARVCPSGSIGEQLRPIGMVEAGRANGIQFGQGRLNVGEAMSPPLIRAVKKMAADSGVCILDAPPGTSCPVVTTVRQADFVLLVTEPTPFGLNDLRLAVELMRSLAHPFGVVVNRAGSGDDSVTRYCQEEQIPLLAEMPDERAAAEAYSRGELLLEASPAIRAALERLAETLGFHETNRDH